MTKQYHELRKFVNMLEQEAADKYNQGAITAEEANLRYNMLTKILTSLHELDDIKSYMREKGKE